MTKRQRGRCPCHANIGTCTWRTIDGRMTGAFAGDRHHVTCDACGRWLSLGASNDAGCEVEIRAAQIVADSFMLWPEALAFDCDDDAEPSGNREHHPSWHAGYLARQIAAHDAGDER